MHIQSITHSTICLAFLFLFLFRNINITSNPVEILMHLEHIYYTVTNSIKAPGMYFYLTEQIDRLQSILIQNQQRKGTFPSSRSHYLSRAVNRRASCYKTIIFVDRVHFFIGFHGNVIISTRENYTQYILRQICTAQNLSGQHLVLQKLI